MGGSMDKPTMLVVLDGFGWAPAGPGNAISIANMPFWHSLCTDYPYQLLKASGEDVGLLPGGLGNSEVGHMTLGAGRVVPATLTLLDELLSSGLLLQHPAIQESLARIIQSGGRIHLVGLLSSGGVHSHEKHLHALLVFFAQQTTAEILIHVILDGRDVPPSSATCYLERLEALCEKVGRGKIVSVQGRFYAMDRDNNQERTALAMRMLRGDLPVLTEKWREVLARSYRHGVTDEFILPALLCARAGISPGDGVVFFNTRPDRMRQLISALTDSDNQVKGLAFLLTPIAYGGSDQVSCQLTLFQQKPVQNTLLHAISASKKSSFVIAETEKYAHVTYFLQGHDESILPLQERVLIPSIKTKNYAAFPAMSAHQITAALIKSLRTAPAFFYVVNFANADMVGHSGDLTATVKACEILDQQLALLYHEVVVRHGGTLCITADHGNAEHKRDAAGRSLTAHTANPVPIVFVSQLLKKHQKNNPMDDTVGLQNGLAAVAPTLLTSMGLSVPLDMSTKLLL